MPQTQNPITPYCQKISVGNSLTMEETGISFAYSLGNVFFLLAKSLWFFALLALLLVTFIVWIWIVSFRTGWYIWEWFARTGSDEQAAVGFYYGIIITLVSPFVLFFNWAQDLLKSVKLLPQSFPSQTNLLEVVEKHLEIKLCTQIPNLVESQKTASTDSANR
ncbi:hypothetical protein [Floridanema flaviceps]